MKRISYFLFVISILAGCSKDNGGNLSINMTYNYTDIRKAAEKSNLVKAYSITDEQRYTQFGDYITSITPTVFIAKFLDMRIQNWDENGTIWNASMNLIDNNTDISSTDRLADFSKGASVNFNPDSKYLNTQNSTEFNIFVFIFCFFYQELELPAQYNTVTNLDHLDWAFQSTGEIRFDDYSVKGKRNGQYIKVSDGPFIKDLIFNEMPHAYVFGKTNNTYIYKSDSHMSINDPLAQGGNIIRSNAYTPITISAIPANEAKTLNGTMTLNINNMIQIYAGVDNIPYTKDDVFVYAPNYWERLSVSIK